MIHTSLIQSRALLARQQLLHQHQHKRVARRIHDDISQQLTLLSLQMSLALTDDRSTEQWSKQCQQWSAMVLELGQNLRGIMNDLQPRILDEFGLGAAFQKFVNSPSQSVQCDLQLPEEPVALQPAAANEIFAICRDVINDVLAANGVTEASIAVEQTHEVLSVQMRTNQKGPELAPLLSKALDALSVHERLFCLDGSVVSQQDPEEGVVITLSLPVSRQPVSNAA